MGELLTAEVIKGIWDTDGGWISWVQFGQAVAEAQLAHTKSQEVCPECGGTKTIGSDLGRGRDVRGRDVIGFSYKPCPTCQGAANTKKLEEVCPECNGVGELTAVDLGYPSSDIAYHCPTCQGTGKKLRPDRAQIAQILLAYDKDVKLFMSGGYTEHPSITESIDQIISLMEGK